MPKCLYKCHDDWRGKEKRKLHTRPPRIIHQFYCRHPIIAINLVGINGFAKLHVIYSMHRILVILHLLVHSLQTSPTNFQVLLVVTGMLRTRLFCLLSVMLKSHLSIVKTMKQAKYVDIIWRARRLHRKLHVRITPSSFIAFALC